MTTQVTAQPVDPATWTAVAPFESLPLDRGVAALVDGRAVAVFRLSDGTLAAVDHDDPVGEAAVMARGLVGSVGDTVTVASPLNKIRYDLRSGRCIDDTAVTPDGGSPALAVWSTRLVDGMVHVRNEPECSPSIDPDELR